MATVVETVPATVPHDVPPPAYDLTNFSTANAHPQGSTTAEGVTVIEPPPPYCLVDPSKVANLNDLPSYSAQLPPPPPPPAIEIIHLHSSNLNGNDQNSHHPTIAAWLVSGSNMDIGTDCTFLMAFVIAFFFNWLGFLAVVCLIPTIAARFGAMSGFGLSVVKWITVMRYHEFHTTSLVGNRFLSTEHRPFTPDPAQNFLFAIILFAGFFLFIRGLISYITIKNRAHQHGQSAEVFTWY